MAGQVLAGQKALDARDGVLRGGTAHLGPFKVRVMELDTFALPDGIVGQGDETVLREGNQYALPGVVRLGSGLVAQRKKDGGERGFPDGWDVEISPLCGA